MSALAVLTPLPVAAAPEAADDAVTRARRGDVAAFESLYRVHAGRIHALCRRLAGDEELARNLTQDAFVRAWEKLPGFRGDAAFGTWLHRLAVNVALAHLRSARRRRRREQDGAVPTEEPPPQHGVEAGVDLERAIAGLPAGARTVFVLHELEGLSHEDIARLTRTSVGTTKAQLHRARQLLRRALA